MKFFAALAFVLPVVAALAPTSTTKRTLQLNPDVASLSPKAPVSASPAPTPETNAQRLARGLNPLSPRHLRRSKTSRANHPRQSQSPPTPYGGILKAVDANGNTVGYLAPTENVFGEYELTTDASSALPVTFSAPADGGLFSVSAPTASASYPFLGGIVGFASTDNNMGTGSFDYSYLGGVPDTPEGPATNQPNTYTDATGLDESTESAIWTFDPSTETLSPHWINDDNSEPTTYLVAIQGLFVITGDVEQFEATFGPEYTLISFILVQPESVPA